ncbi:hypothetical protein DERF_014231 [Dermatophagoides farinae]|uniref:Cytochrome b-c1 complex subunit 8 n=1 Tax=Dermatophagoides farinae TaxID=6954 RepID=A0A922HNM8_DERFA|nr:hypothetical protein DERF_014231 [Dermatophagoides farinae]
MVSTADPELTKAFQELQIQVLNTREKVRHIEAEISSCERQALIYEITKKTVADLKPGHECFIGLGRAFARQDRPEILALMDTRIENNQEKIRTMKQAKNYQEGKHTTMGGKTFGNLAFIRNVIYIRLSPYEQKAFPNYLKNTWNGFRRDFNNVFPYAAPPFLASYLIYTWGNQENERASRKNPADYVNDE